MLEKKKPIPKKYSTKELPLSVTVQVQAPYKKGNPKKIFKINLDYDKFSYMNCSTVYSNLKGLPQ